MGGQTWSHCQPRVDLRKLVPKTLMLCDFQMEKSSTSLKRLSDREVTWRKLRHNERGNKTGWPGGGGGTEKSGGWACVPSHEKKNKIFSLDLARFFP